MHVHVREQTQLRAEQQKQARSRFRERIGAGRRAVWPEYSASPPSSSRERRGAGCFLAFLEGKGVFAVYGLHGSIRSEPLRETLKRHRIEAIQRRELSGIGYFVSATAFH